MKLSRDSVLALVLILALLIVTIAAAVQQSRDQLPTLATFSSARNGALALKLWIGALGYNVSEESSVSFAPPEAADLIFILEPLQVSDDDLRALDDWLAQGGTLVIAGRGLGASQLAGHYDIPIKFLGKDYDRLNPQTPLLSSPPINETISDTDNAVLDPDRSDYVTLLAAGQYPVLVSFPQGKGRVIFSAVTHPFTNAGLQEPGNSDLILNLVSFANAHSVWFDEWHHGERGDAIIGPEQWLRRTPAGRSLLFVFFAVFFVLVLQGRGFGRPVPLPRSMHRRGPMEHVTAIANLNRRAGQRASVMNHYHHQIKRQLGRRYRLDPSLPDESYVETLARYNPALHQTDLLNLLNQLRNPHVGETEMIRLAARSAEWLE
jgi:hypothetical protein